MNDETRTALALHACDTRAELLEVAEVLCWFASVAGVVGHVELRDRLVERAAVVLGATTSDRYCFTAVQVDRK